MAFYDFFQLIAYEVPTDQILKAGQACEVQRLADSLNELKQGLSEDALSRLLRMVAVVEKARVSPQRAARTNTLKIFVAPEFYFRPEAEGAGARSYPAAEKDLIVRTLGEVFKHEDFKSWLLVLGTIVWSAKGKDILDAAALPNQQDAKLKQVQRSDIVWNTAIVVEGGTDKLITFNKQHYDGADGIDTKYRPELTGKGNQGTPFDKLQEDNRQTLASYFETSKQANRQRSIITVGDNLRLGIEVCLDHRLAVLKKSYQELCQSMGNNAPAPELDLQLLTACGMEVQGSSLVIDARKLIVRMDGVSNAKAVEVPAPSEIQRVLGAGEDGVKFTSTQHAQDKDAQQEWAALNKHDDTIKLAPPQKLIPILKKNVAVRYEPAANDNQEPKSVDVELDVAYPQQVVIYQPVKFEHLDVQQEEE